MKRVMVLGAPGSGKSTFAVALGAATGLPVYHMDMIHHLPGWVERPKPEKIAMAGQVEARDAWVFEGGLSATYANRAARADTAIWLDLPLPLRLWRVVKRRWHYRGGLTRPDLPQDCPERVDWEFLHWIITTNRTGRKKIQTTLDAAPHLIVHHLTTRGAVNSILSGPDNSGN